MDENQQAETVTAEKETGKVGTATTENTAGSLERTFTQADINEIVEKRLARERKTWEKELSTKTDDKAKTNEVATKKSEVKDLQLKLAEYEKQIAFSKFSIDEDYKDFVAYKVLRSVSKDKDYATALQEFFDNDNNKRYLKGEKSINMPRPGNIGGSTLNPILSKYGDVKPLNKGKI